MDRRLFLKSGIAISAAGYLAPAFACMHGDAGKIITVNGPIAPAAMGLTLIHEHVMVDFIGADKTTPARYNSDEVFKVVLPYFEEIRKAGCKTFIDCTPAWLGRDVKILQRLSHATGINILTNTGYYGAAQEKFLPELVKTKTAEEIAEIWISESENGIDNTGIKPGFMKLSVDGLPFSPSIEKILKAAAITNKKTGLVIGVHTGKGGDAATRELDILTSYGVPGKSWIWIHAQNEADLNFHISLAKRGGWISFDGISKQNTAEYVKRLEVMKKEKLLQKVLVSQDAGWYNIGEPGGGNFRNYNDFFTDFLPALKTSGFTADEINQLTVVNPSVAYRV